MFSFASKVICLRLQEAETKVLLVHLNRSDALEASVRPSEAPNQISSLVHPAFSFVGTQVSLFEATAMPMGLGLVQLR